MDLLVIKNDKEVMEVFNPINVIRATISKKNQTVTWFFVDGSFASMNIKEVTKEIKEIFKLELKENPVVVEVPHTEHKAPPPAAKDDDDRDNE